MDRFKTPKLVVEETGIYVTEQQAYLNLIRTAEVLGTMLSDLLAKSGISGKQYNILRAVRRHGEKGATISAIGDQMTDPRADVTRLIDRLEREGFVGRRHDKADRRVVRVILTKRGDVLLTSLDKPVVDLHRRQFANLTQDEMSTIIRLLQKTRQGADTD
jgi:DNA-binding MarR family transcriptional regulator